MRASSSNAVEEPAERGSGVQPPAALKEEIGYLSVQGLSASCMEAKWQVMYERGGYEYWWDCPKEVSQVLKTSPTESLSWVWGWPHRDGQKIQKRSRYILNPVERLQYNLDTQSKRQMRRIMVIQ